MKKIIFLLILLVITLAGLAMSYQRPSCQAFFNGKPYQCSLGVTGVSLDKKEGDGATPVGDFAIRQVFYRPDRLPALETSLPTVAMQPEMGWCDDPKSPYYNKEIKTPFEQSHENLWREDGVYDIVAVVGYNDEPIVKGKGSAIFIHIARQGYTPTAGCIAFAENDLLEILKGLNANAHIKIEPNGKVTLYNR